MVCKKRDDSSKSIGADRCGMEDVQNKQNGRRIVDGNYTEALCDGDSSGVPERELPDLTARVRESRVTRFVMQEMNGN